ncbi:MAG: outer membrane lipoprotein-sorting protein, partial [Candidatus Binatia bacterium]
LDDHLPALAEQHGVAFHYSGDLPTALATVVAIVGTQLRSVGWALLTVVLVLFVLFAPGKQALVCMTPVIAAVVVVFGGMGYAGMSLGIATSMFASLTIGVGVDFAIHLFYRYREESLAGRGHDSALEVTIHKAGRAVGWNVLVLSLGFLVLGFSGLKPNHSLGILLASAMAACYVATMLFLPCMLRVVGTGTAATGLALGAILMVTCAPCAFAASPESAVKCTATPDADATAILEKLERVFRGRRHIVRMAIRTAYGAAHPLRKYAETHPSEKILWGVFDGDLQETRLLYVFSGPGRLAGTTLLVNDYADPARDDAIWIYIRSLNSFNKIGPGTQRVMVPGTPLTYEDSRGFIPSDTYDFSFPTSTNVELEEADVLVLGCPKSEAVRERLGYSSLLIVVDKDKNMVKRVYYRDLGGKLLKTYELVEARESRAGWEASQIRMDHRTDGYSATIDLEHWYPDESVPDEIYRAEATDEKFLPRLERVLTGAKLNKRLEQEIAAADETIRVYDQRMREMQEKRNAER